MNKPLYPTQSLGRKPQEPLAIVGIGCRFPGGGNTPDAFWGLLRAGVDTFTEIPEGRWDKGRYNDADSGVPGTAINFEGGFLSEAIDEMDADFFGISHREAANIDPQQRILMEIVWEAFEDGGLAVDQFGGKDVGVYVGGFTTDTLIGHFSPEKLDLLNSHSAISATLGMLANRISFLFDFRGPSITIDTACSSSLVALNYACRDLWSGECSVAVAAGVNIMLRPEFPIAMTKGGFLAQNSRSKAFSADADGYGRGEGGGAVVLKRLSEAQADGDRIYAVVRGVGINQDGRTPAITVPNARAQQQLIERVYGDFGIDPADVGYVEAHGTGTPVGDPLEMQALGAAIGAGRRAMPTCMVGSVKANIGHQEAAAGIASTIKAAMVLTKRQVPPQINFSSPNPNIPFEAHGFRVPTQVEELPRGENPTCVSINSFGFGGSNAHAVLGEAPVLGEELYRRGTDTPKGLAAFADGTSLVPVSARSAAGLQELAGAFAETFAGLGAEAGVESNTNFNSLLAAMALRRSHAPHRLAVLAKDAPQAAQKLRQFPEGAQDTGIYSGRGTGAEDRPVVFVFTGMGPQWWKMGRELSATSPVYRAAVEQADAAFTAHSGWSILAEMEKSEDLSRMTSNEIAQPANFIVQVGLLALWRALGVRPTAIIGHSVGEVAAAYAAGCLTLDEAALVSYHRSRCQQKMAGKGAMLAVGLSEEAAADLAALYEGQVSVAAVNAPNSVALAGDVEALRDIGGILEEEEVFAKLLRVEVAYHSHQMDPLEGELKAVLAGLEPHAPEVPLWSTVTGAQVSTALHDAEYWWQNVRQTVRFGDAMADMAEQGFDLFVEVGPHPVLAPAIKQIVTAKAGQADVLRSLSRGAAEGETLQGALAELYCAGAAIDWSAVYGAHCAHQTMPLYPWQRERFWFEEKTAQAERPKEVLLGRKSDSPEPMWQSELTHSNASFLQDHVVDGAVVFPGAGYVQMMLAAQRQNSAGSCGVIEEIAFKNALAFENSDKLVLRTYISDTDISIYGRRAGEGTAWTDCAGARLSSAKPRQDQALVDLAALKQAAGAPVEIELLYQMLAERGLRYGPYFQGIKELYRDGNKILARLEAHTALELSDEEETLHPTVLDAAFQALIAGLDTENPLYDAQAVFIPVGIARFSQIAPVNASAEAQVWCVGEITQTSRTEIVGALTFCDASGHVVARVEGFKCQALHQAKPGNIDPLKGLFYQYEWHEAEALAAMDTSGNWLVVGGADAQARDICDGLQARGANAIHARRGAEFKELAQGRYQLTFDNPLDWARLTTSLAGGFFDSIVFLGEDRSEDPIGELACTDLLGVVQNIGASARTSLSIVTQGAGAPLAQDGQTGTGGQFALTGLARVIGNEYPELDCRLIDIQAGASANWRAVLMDELITPERAEDEVALRPREATGEGASGRYVHRLTSVDFPDGQNEEPVLSPATMPFMLDLETEGDINSARFIETERVAPGADEVELRLHAVALNFKDVLKIMGVLSADIIKDTFFGESIGMEAAAEVLAVGANVTNFKPGDRVVAAVANGCFRSYTTVESRHVHAFPDHPDHEFVDLSGMPVVFVTAIYGLEYIARMQPGEKVLLHSASGGVGLAAIQVAKALGAEIYATAGNEEKRALLRSHGVKHVFDSRSLDFVDDIMAASGGTGMDVILNFLPGEAQEKSVSLLAPFGRFIEIGKRDIDENRGLGLRPFNRNLQFSAVDIDRMLAEKPDLFDAVLHDVWVGLDKGIYRPIETTQFAIADFAEACHVMRRAEHIGKIVVRIAGEELPVVPLPVEDKLCTAQASYLVTGGFGGFGLKTALWLADQGAETLVLAGRSGAVSDAAKATVAQLEARGVRVIEQRVDIANGAAVQAMMAEIAQDAPPLRGVFHTAAVLDDGLLADMSAEQFARAMAAKATGALHLHTKSLGLELDHFVLFSSVSALIGNPGQGNYSAANTYLDGLAHMRRAQGLPGLSVNWGALAEVGMAARDEKVAARLSQIGIAGIPPNTALEALARVSRTDHAQVGVMDVDWARWQQVNAVAAQAPKYQELMSNAQADDSRAAQLATHLCEMEEGAQVSHLIGVLSEQIASVLRMPVERLDIAQPLSDMGIDSLMMVDVQLAVEEGTGLEVSVMELSRGGSISRLAQAFLGRLLGADQSANVAASAPAAIETGADQVDTMSNAQVEAMLADLAKEEDA